MPNTAEAQQENLGPLDLIAQDRKRDKELHKAKRPLVEFNTPGLECPHADAGCCPKCAPSTMQLTRLRLRHPLPKTTIRKMYDSTQPARPAKRRASLRRPTSSRSKA